MQFANSLQWIMATAVGLFGQLSVERFQQKTVTASSEQLNNLLSQSVEILPAAGANLQSVPLFIIYSYNAGSTAYVLAADGVQYTGLFFGDPIVLGSIAPADYGGDSDIVATSGLSNANNTTWGVEYSNINAPIPAGGNRGVFYASNINGNSVPTGGDGTLTITVIYVTIPVA